MTEKLRNEAIDWTKNDLVGYCRLWTTFLDGDAAYFQSLTVTVIATFGDFEKFVLIFQVV